MSSPRTLNASASVRLVREEERVGEGDKMEKLDSMVNKKRFKEIKWYATQWAWHADSTVFGHHNGDYHSAAC